MIVRPAEPRDATAIAEIWNVYIRDTTVTFTTDEKTPERVAQRIVDRQDDGHCLLVAEADARCLGFAMTSEFRPGPGYAHTREISIMLRADVQRIGVGRQLMAALEREARAGGARVLVAGISGENEAALAFHAALGFTQTGRLTGVGRKFDRALDLVFMQKTL